MAHRPTMSRVGRPRSRSAQQTPKSTAKIGRPRSKSVQKPKVKSSAKKNTNPAKRAVRPILQLEQEVVEVVQRPFGDQLPDLPLLDLEQGDYIPLNPLNQLPDLPAGEENQAGELIQNPPPEQEEHNYIVQPPNQPNQPNQPNKHPNPLQNLPTAMANPQQLNWSYFKPEFSGKPEEDAEAHLLRTNDWMETHNFPNDQKVRRFCLTLTEEARLWYETLGAAQLDWEALQDRFWQQYSKFGNTQ